MTTGDQYYKPDFAVIVTAVKNMVIFDALFLSLNGFALVNLHHQDESVQIFSSKHKYAHLKTQ